MKKILQISILISIFIFIFSLLFDNPVFANTYEIQPSFERQYVEDEVIVKYKAEVLPNDLTADAIQGLHPGLAINSVERVFKNLNNISTAQKMAEGVQFL